MRILIHGGKTIDPASRLNEPADILIEDGKIVDIIRAGGRKKDVGAIQARLPDRQESSMLKIDAAGKLIFPGLIDVHTHVREPGFEYKETIRTATESAAAGGFTTICAMPNSRPVNDNQSVTRFILNRAQSEGLVQVLPIGAITKGSQGEELAEIGELKQAGCVAVSDDGHPVAKSSVMRLAMEYAKTFDLPVIDHCEDPLLSEGGVMNEGVVATELGLPGIPAAAEEVMVSRNIILAQETGARLHLAHISTAGSVRLIREGKARGIQVTAEACPHHFCLTEEAVRGYNTHAKMNPPLRTQKDLEEIRAGLADGTIDIIATDHAPHSREEKEQEFSAAPFGVVGLETALSLTMMLVDEGVLTLDTAISKLTVQPAKLLGIEKGRIKAGADADLVIFDPEEWWVVDPAQFRSKGRNTPFAGWKLKGRVVTTMVKGVPVFSPSTASSGKKEL
jgi:dihydroorotase